MSAILRLESICTDTKKDTAFVTACGKTFVRAHDWLTTAYGTALRSWPNLLIQRAVQFSPFSPASVMAPVLPKPSLDVCLREEGAL